jgi:Na+/H+ antiporter NhaD/arsenite permease-like protein
MVGRLMSTLLPAEIPAFLLLTPFVGMLLSVSLLPLLAPAWWEREASRLGVAGLFGAPVAAWLSVAAPQRLQHAVLEYLAFMIVLVALYVVTSHIVVAGHRPATPASNLGLLGVGTLLASCIGTTGTTMLLVRPLLRSNAARPHRAHVFVFFIFLAGNMGGLLTPMGDPPLYMGLLRGVPFFWTLRLWPAWLFCNGITLLEFYCLDAYIARRWPAPHTAPVTTVPWRLEGGRNLLLLLCLVGLVAASGLLGLPALWVNLLLLGLAGLAWTTSPAELRRKNDFSWAPIREVGILFAGIFLTMAPVLLLLETQRSRLLLAIDPERPAPFFWITGVLSSVLDNAPTYLTATATASSLLERSPLHLEQLAADPRGAPLLAAISCGAVLMGTLTYLGNGPNLLVKAVAEAQGTRMPSFFAYLGISCLVLLPSFAVLAHFMF